MMKEIRNAKGLTEAEFLAQYKPGNYERPSVTVDMIILAMNQSFDKLKVLLIKRKDHPYIEKWALPGGFVKMDESAYAAAGRELEEETGLKDIYMEQVYTMSQPDRDPRMRVISVDYMALINERDVCAGDDAKEAKWFDISLDEKSMILQNEEMDIRIKYLLKPCSFKNGVIKVNGFVPYPAEDSKDALAFDHAQSILEGLTRIRNKVMYSDIAFNLVPEEFTLPDLQAVYETILGKELYKTNFKAGLAGRIVPLDKKGPSITGGKKSMLYRYLEQ